MLQHTKMPPVVHTADGIFILKTEKIFRKIDFRDFLHHGIDELQKDMVQ